MPKSRVLRTNARVLTSKQHCGWYQVKSIKATEVRTPKKNWQY